ncbi:MAG: M48 family metallopeptidase [Bacteroidota bacterium]
MKPEKSTRFMPLVMAVLFIACSTVPLTGRQQLNIIPDSQLLAMSYQEYGTFVNSATISKDGPKTLMVRRVASKIQKAVEDFAAQKGLSDHLNGYAWEVNLVESDDANAWAMPGGKIVVYTGILPITKTETGLAVVMGHEVAHAVAEHGGERMSQALIAQMGGMALDKALEKEPEQTRALWLTAFGIGAQVGVLLPFSRTQESEADHMGLVFMAMAGYDPNEAVSFWQRMAAKGGAAPPEWLSTHPSGETRINDIKAHLPEALQHYKKPG